MAMFGVISSMWALVTIGLFILAARISYQIERRSNPEKFERWPLRYANPIGSALNINVARDAETQALRKKLLMHLAAIGLLFLIFIVLVTTQTGNTPAV